VANQAIISKGSIGLVNDSMLANAIQIMSRDYNSFLMLRDPKSNKTITH